MVDSDDSDGDENFTPSKAELDDHEEEDESSGDSEAEPTTGEDEPASSPVKGSKKRKIATKASQKNKKGRTSPEGDSSLLATPVGKFVSSLVNSSSSGRKSPLSHSSLSSPGVSHVGLRLMPMCVPPFLQVLRRLMVPSLRLLLLRLLLLLVPLFTCCCC